MCNFCVYSGEGFVLDSYGVNTRVEVSGVVRNDKYRLGKVIAQNPILARCQKLNMEYTELDVF